MKIGKLNTTFHVDQRAGYPVPLLSSQMPLARLLFTRQGTTGLPSAERDQPKRKNLLGDIWGSQ